MTLGELIHTYRKEHGLSMDAFAQKSGLSKAYISILERNRNPSTGREPTLSLDTVRAVAAAMQMDAQQVIALLDGADALPASDPLIAYYGQVKDQLDDADIADLMTFMRIKAQMKQSHS